MKTLKMKLVALAIMAVMLFMAGCVVVQYGENSYWRLGPQHLDNVEIIEPNGVTIRFGKQESNGYADVIMELLRRLPK